jgi:uncharacterized membrane protein YkoI
MKTLILTILISACFLLAGCGDMTGDDMMTTTSPSTTASQSTSQSTNAASTEPSISESGSVSGNQTMAGKTISREDAINKAISHAGFENQSVSGIYAEYDIDDGRGEYEVEFTVNGNEYDYVIDAENGSVISYEKEIFE